PISTLFPYTTLFRSLVALDRALVLLHRRLRRRHLLRRDAPSRPLVALEVRHRVGERRLVLVDLPLVGLEEALVLLHRRPRGFDRSEEHTSELQSRGH